MRITQITDFHVGKEGEDTHGVDVRANFLKILEAVCAVHPDELMLSGDLCFDKGEAEIYDWIRPHLEKLGVPYRLISGNHDDPQLMANAFGLNPLLKGGELYYRADYGAFPALFFRHNAICCFRNSITLVIGSIGCACRRLDHFYAPPAIAGRG